MAERYLHEVSPLSNESCLLPLCRWRSGTCMKCHPYLMNHVTPVQMAERYLHEVSPLSNESCYPCADGREVPAWSAAPEGCVSSYQSPHTAAAGPAVLGPMWTDHCQARTQIAHQTLPAGRTQGWGVGVGNSVGWDGNVRSHFPMLVCTGAPSGSCIPASGSLSCHRNYASWKRNPDMGLLTQTVKIQTRKRFERMLLIRTNFAILHTRKRWG